MYRDIHEVKATNKAAGLYFFDLETVAFFNSHTLPQLYGGCVFVTSERYSPSTPVRYTVRECLRDGHIETVGEFQAYATKEAALSAAREYAARMESPTEARTEGV